MEALHFVTVCILNDYLIWFCCDILCKQTADTKGQFPDTNFASDVKAKSFVYVTRGKFIFFYENDGNILQTSVIFVRGAARKL